MIIEKELKISAKNFYDKIIDSVVFDIRKTTGKDVTRNQLKNFEYIKEFSKINRARILIEEVVPNRVYQFRTSTTRNDFTVRYEIEELAENRCKIHYEETMKSFGFMQQMNDAVMGIPMGFFKKRNFKKMMEMIEKSA